MVPLRVLTVENDLGSRVQLPIVLLRIVHVEPQLQFSLFQQESARFLDTIRVCQPAVGFPQVLKHSLVLRMVQGNSGGQYNQMVDLMKVSIHGRNRTAMS
jgi:hypothetical protein